MNTEFFEAVRPAAERVGWVLVHSTWQGVAIAAMLWIVLAVMGKRSAARRYAAGCVALAAIVATMAVTFARVEGTRRVALVAGRASLPTAVDLRVGDVPVPAVAGVAQDEPKPAADAPSWDVKRQIAPWLPVVVGAWVIGVAGLAVWHFGGWVRVRRMTRAGATAAWEDRVGQLARRMGVNRGVRVVESALAGVPAVVGFVRPVILLPVGLAAEMSAAQVEAILLHELAHVRRNDYLVNLVQTAIETLLFYHPAVWWISGQIRQEREHCCDDLAVAACGDRAGYARALARVEEIRGATLPLAAAAVGGSLLQRVRRIAGNDVHDGRRATPLAAIAVAAVLCGGLMLVAAEPPEATTSPARKVAEPPHDPVFEQLASELMQAEVRLGEAVRLELATRKKNPDVPWIRLEMVNLQERVNRHLTARDAGKIVPAATRPAVGGKRVRVTVGRDSVSVDGKAVEPFAVGEALRAIPEADRPSTVVEVAAEAEDVPVGRFMQVFAACAARAQALGMAPVSNVGVQAHRSPPTATRPATVPVRIQGEFYMEGNIKRPGVYSLNGRDVTLSQAIISAGMPTDGGAYVSVIRRDENRRVAVAENVVIEDLLGKRIESMVLRPYDLVRVSAEKLQPFGPAAEIRPAPHAGDFGEVYVGGHVRRPGVYSTSGRKLTVGLILASAGGLDTPKSDVVEVRRREGKDRETIIRSSFRKILEGNEPDLYLQPNDEVSFGMPEVQPPAGK